MRGNPMWKTSLLICAILVALVTGYFAYQVHTASNQFRKNSREHSKVLAAAVELNIRNAMLSNNGLELVITDFLKNSARFISYLNVIERFDQQELSAFARESGLAGITIVSTGEGVQVSGPEGWAENVRCSQDRILSLDIEKHLYSYVYTSEDTEECVVVGFASDDVAHIRQSVSVETLLEKLSELPGIVSVQLEKSTLDSSGQEEQLAKLVQRDGQKVTETRIRINDSDLIVTQRAGHFAKRLKQMAIEFMVFVGLLLVFGVLSSWWLYHAERRRLAEAREYEKEMARQHEEAVLGRAAGTIAHEIRNPLNAINMGLQRLQLETEGLDPEHLDLLVSMRQAVARSNGIITNLQQYVRSFEVTKEQVKLLPLIRSVLDLYGAACKAQGVEVVLEADAEYTVPGDTGLLGQLFENVIKNGVEAQSHGGYCRISVSGSDTYCRVRLENGGFLLSEDDSKQLFEPYFTSKVQGTGLGLAISQKIVEAHGGSIAAEPDIDRQSLVLLIDLPRK
ncbi:MULTISPECIES: ATP-binding protein [Desulfosediminicola]|uniref:sensor histidine kinase n=1 Tax=Desulfosediminicola TaxID=2886823 RepID=UPI0010AD801F|nr:ATP-binding protein [Desulfosediminicola ganghwensis]